MATKNDIDTGYPIEIEAGGTLKQSFDSYGVICAGTTTTGALQSVPAAASGLVLMSQGPSALPTWGSTSGMAGALVLLDSQTASASSELEFITGITSTYNVYYLIFDKIVVGTGGDSLYLTVSTDGGSTYVSTGYFSGINTIDHGSTTTVNTNVSNGAQWQLSPALSTSGFCSALWVTNVTSGSTVGIFGDATLWNNSGNLRIGSIMGYNSGALTVDALKIVASTGNIASGTVYLYGLTQ